MKSLLIAVPLVIVLIIILALYKAPKTQPSSSKCGLTCSNNPHLDPVNDPDYNVREVIKNTLLIEQHLAEDQKYCKECIVKHFLISIAYLEEGIWMACKNCEKYPKLKESLSFYNVLFEKWYKNMEDQETRLQTLQELRAWRQDMIRLYYF